MKKRIYQYFLVGMVAVITVLMLQSSRLAAAGSSTIYFDIVVDDARQLVYGSNRTTNAVDILSWTTGQPLGSIPLGGEPFNMDLKPDGSELAVAVSSLGKIAFIDLDSQTIAQWLEPVGATHNMPFDVIYGRPGRLYSTGNTGGFDNVHVIDTDNYQDLGHGAEIIRGAPFLAITADGNSLYVIDLNDQLYLYDISTDVIQLVTSKTVVGKKLIVTPDGEMVVTNFGQVWSGDLTTLLGTLDISGSSNFIITIDVGYAHLNNRAFISRYQGFADHNLLIEYDLNSLQRLLEYEISEQIGVPRANLAGDEIFLSTAAGIQRFPADLSPHAMLPIVGRLACDDLVDDFGSAATGWPVVNTPALLARYLSGEYQIVVRQPSALHAFRSPSLCIFQNYHVGADVHWQGPGGNSYGIIFGMYQGFQRFYIFDMNATLRQFRLLYYDGNGYQQIVSPRFSSSIVPDSGVNHLLVEVENQRVVLRINGTAVAILDALSGVEQPTSAGILVSSGIDSTDPDVRFDNFQFVKIADAGVGTPLAMTGHDLAEQPVWITISEAENPLDNLLLWPE